MPDDTRDEATRARRGGGPPIGWLVVIGALSLAAVVWLALPKDAPPPSEGPADATEADVDARAAEITPRDRIPSPGQAAIELGVIVDEDARKLATIEQASRLLTPKVCGAACPRVSTFVRDATRFELATMSTADWGLPDREGRRAMGPTLTPAELASLDARPLVLVVRAHGEGAPDHLPARAAYAVAAALAEATSGIVYDEVVRRIEGPKAFAAHVITAPLGADVLRADHFTVQLYPQGDAGHRLVSLGLGHFGCPDLVMQGLSEAAGPTAASALDGIAGQLARGARTSPVEIGAEDVSRVVGRPSAELVSSGGAGRVAFTLVEAQRVAGDPDNTIVEVVPPGGATPEAHAGAIRRLFGDAALAADAGRDAGRP